MIHLYMHTYQGMDPGLSALLCPASPLYTEQQVGTSVCGIIGGHLIKKVFGTNFLSCKVFGQKAPKLSLLRLGDIVNNTCYIFILFGVFLYFIFFGLITGGLLWRASLFILIVVLRHWQKWFEPWTCLLTGSELDIERIHLILLIVHVPTLLGKYAVLQSQGQNSRNSLCSEEIQKQNPSLGILVYFYPLIRCF